MNYEISGGYAAHLRWEGGRVSFSRIQRNNLQDHMRGERVTNRSNNDAFDVKGKREEKKTVNKKRLGPAETPE